MVKKIHLTATVPVELSGQRIDQVLAQLFPQFSRSRLKEWLLSDQIRIDQRSLKPKEKVRGGEAITVNSQLEEDTQWQAQAIELSIVHEDDSIIVINKPAGLVMHPAAGNPDHTLLNALLHHAPELKQIPRAGIVHRLDKDTSGILVVTKTLEAHTHIIKQLQQRTMSREYQALVMGVVTHGGTVDAPIGRHPRARKKMAVVDNGKPAVSHYRVLERFAAHTLLQVKLETGRTHQIRVHMAHLQHPIVGDPLYGGRLRIPAQSSESQAQALREFKRQALHAFRLSLIHPRTHKSMEFSTPLADDMVQLLTVLRESQ